MKEVWKRVREECEGKRKINRGEGSEEEEYRLGLWWTGRDEGSMEDTKNVKERKVRIQRRKEEVKNTTGRNDERKRKRRREGGREKTARVREMRVKE